MKRFILFITLTVAINSLTIAQSSYNEGNNMLSLGIGIGNNYFGTGYTSSLPVNPTATFEHRVSEELSAGATISYASSKYKFSDGIDHVTYKATSTYIGVRGAYHLNEILNLETSKLDTYGGVGLGYVVVSYSGNVNGTTFSEGSVGSGVGYALFVGGRYYFSKKAAIYAELGYASLSVLNVGLTFKF